MPGISVEPPCSTNVVMLFDLLDGPRGVVVGVTAEGVFVFLPAIPTVPISSRRFGDFGLVHRVAPGEVFLPSLSLPSSPIASRRAGACPRWRSGSDVPWEGRTKGSPGSLRCRWPFPGATRPLLHLPPNTAKGAHISIAAPNVPGRRRRSACGPAGHCLPLQRVVEAGSAPPDGSSAATNLLRCQPRRWLSPLSASRTLPHTQTPVRPGAGGILST